MLSFQPPSKDYQLKRCCNIFDEQARCARRTGLPDEARRSDASMWPTTMWKRATLERGKNVDLAEDVYALFGVAVPGIEISSVNYWQCSQTR